MLIGRSSRCDFRIFNPYVSGRHASLDESPDGTYTLNDLNSENCTFINSLDQQVKGPVVICENDLIFFSDHYKVSAGHLIRFLQDSAQVQGREPGDARGKLQTFTEERLTIGSAPECGLCLSYLSVLNCHAEILQAADGLRYLRPVEGPVFVNGTAHFVGATVELDPRDAIDIGGVTIALDFTRSDPRTLSIGAERDGIYFGARNLSVSVKDRDSGDIRDLLKEISFSVYPGELVGLLGPSGCGKTTLLSALSGSSRPTAGQVLYNGADLYQQLSRFANQTGYVPQDDIMHPELKVGEVLKYSARLRVPTSVAEEAIEEKIDGICKQLGLLDLRYGLDLRNQLVGSTTRKVLSGGQKKRVNLGIELLTDPRALFLDEPTSGLSSHDTRLVMENLRALATDKGIAIIITIHQPSLAVYKLFDHVIYLKSGRLAYFGPAFPQSITHFVPDEDPAITGPDGVMERIDQLTPEGMEKSYRNSPLWREFVERRSKALPAANEDGRAAKFAVGPSPLAQTLTLAARSLRCKARDKASLIVLAVQAPIVAILLMLAFRDREMNAPLFLLGFVSIWFGTNNTAREIVGERDILARETRSGLHVGSYLLSKWLVHGLILACQCILLVGLTRLLLGFEAPIMLVTLICLMAGLVGVGIGLLISTLAKTEITAIILVPLVLIPFIMLGGLVASYDSSPRYTRALINLMPSRWAYESLLHIEALQPSKDPDYQDWKKGSGNKPLFRLSEFSREPFEEFLPDSGKLYTKELKELGGLGNKTHKDMFDLKLPKIPPAKLADEGKLDALRSYRWRRIALGLSIMIAMAGASGFFAWRKLRGGTQGPTAKPAAAPLPQPRPI